MSKNENLLAAEDNKFVNTYNLTQKIIGNAPHPLVGQNDPYDDDVAHCRHHHHAGEKHRPQHLAPPW